MCCEKCCLQCQRWFLQVRIRSTWSSFFFFFFFFHSCSHRTHLLVLIIRTYVSEQLFSGKYLCIFGHTITFECDNREFDEGLLQRIPEISFEDDMNDIPSPPDVSNYLVSEVSCLFDILDIRSGVDAAFTPFLRLDYYIIFISFRKAVR